MALGGKREGAGRKPKTDEQTLIEKLKPLEPAAHQALATALQQKQPWAVKLYMEYMYGKPKQTVDQNNTHTFADIKIKDLVSFDNG